MDLKCERVNIKTTAKADSSLCSGISNVMSRCCRKLPLAEVACQLTARRHNNNKQIELS
jgi:hypothetical protein